MNLSCREIEEALWEHARTGSPLAGNVRRHVDRCPACARVLEESEQIICAASDDYAACAPDCRAAVRARIADARPRVRLAWGYACATAVLAVVVVAGLVLRGPTTAPRRLASKPPAAQRSTAPRVQPERQRTAAPRVEIKKQPATNLRQTVPVRKQLPHRARRIRHSRPAPAREMPILVKVTPPPSAEDVTPRPIAAVIVTGIVDERNPDMSYGYRERDAATGITTECSVTKSGNSIDIRMESTPGGEKLPVKGSIDNEKDSNA